MTDVLGLLSEMCTFNPSSEDEPNYFKYSFLPD
jgi:hypothetical protein